MHAAIAAHVFTKYRQTNNTAQLLAVIRAFLRWETLEYALICSTLSWAWQALHGAGKSVAGLDPRDRFPTFPFGPVSNVPLWEQLLDELDCTQRTVHWIKVPSHVTIEGNNEADRLAEQGRHMHPCFPHPCTPYAHTESC